MLSDFEDLLDIPTKAPHLWSLIKSAKNVKKYPNNDLPISLPTLPISTVVCSDNRWFTMTCPSIRRSQMQRHFERPGLRVALQVAVGMPIRQLQDSLRSCGAIQAENRFEAASHRSTHTILQNPPKYWTCCPKDTSKSQGTLCVPSGTGSKNRFRHRHSLQTETISNQL